MNIYFLIPIILISLGIISTIIYKRTRVQKWEETATSLWLAGVLILLFIGFESLSARGEAIERMDRYEYVRSISEKLDTVSPEVYYIHYSEIKSTNKEVDEQKRRLDKPTFLCLYRKKFPEVRDMESIVWTPVVIANK